MARGDVMAVRMDVARAVLIDGIAAEVERRAAAGGGRPPAALAEAFGDDAVALRVAWAGWLTREVELERFERAREPVTWLREDDCARLAAREPLDRPRPDDPDAATWRVPGPGGHVRHELAAAAIAAAGGGPRELKRAWVHGFLARSCAGAAD